MTPFERLTAEMYWGWPSPTPTEPHRALAMDERVKVLCHDVLDAMRAHVAEHPPERGSNLQAVPFLTTPDERGES